MDKTNRMKKISLPLLIIAVFLLVAGHASAQYRVAAGLKFGGYENGLTGKYFLDDRAALEGVLGFRSHGLAITGLYEIHQTAFNVKDLKFYYGGGAHVGAVGSGSYRRYNGDDYDYHNSTILLGADGVIGLEYLIPNSPIGVSLDLNPRIELATGPFFDIAPGLGLKYVFR
ncbi:hypothetical protein [Mucilaginibacter sp.]